MNTAATLNTLYWNGDMKYLTLNIYLLHSGNMHLSICFFALCTDFGEQGTVLSLSSSKVTKLSTNKRKHRERKRKESFNGCQRTYLVGDVRWQSGPMQVGMVVCGQNAISLRQWILIYIFTRAVSGDRDKKQYRKICFDIQILPMHEYSKCCR